MKALFSILIDHDYDKVDADKPGVSNDLAIIPADSSAKLLSNDRLRFRSRSGRIDCYIETDGALLNEVKNLFFWVLCVDPAFYSYTDYPNHVNFSSPYFYWSNAKGSNVLEQKEACDLHPGKPPKNAIGCVGVTLESITDYQAFTIPFAVRKTYWRYHIVKSEPQDLITAKLQKAEEFNIVDTVANQNELKWQFEKSSDPKTPQLIIFQSKTPLAYKKKAGDRLKLIWGPKNKNKHQEDQEMILPYANYEYKMVNKDNKELTPIYIHI